MSLSNADLGQMVFHILQQDYHRPFINGKCNRDNIEDQIVIGMYKKEIPPISEEEVDIICELVDDLINTGMKTGVKK